MCWEGWAQGERRRRGRVRGDESTRRRKRRRGDAQKKKIKVLLAPRCPEHKVSTRKRTTAILPSSAASTRCCLLAQGNAHSHVHAHTYTHTYTNGVVRELAMAVRFLCPGPYKRFFCFVCFIFFISTTTVSAGFYKKARF